MSRIPNTRSPEEVAQAFRSVASELNGKWYFAEGARLWRTDGTREGVELVVVLPVDVDETSLTTVGPWLLFTTNSSPSRFNPS